MQRTAGVDQRIAGIGIFAGQNGGAATCSLKPAGTADNAGIGLRGGKAVKHQQAVCAVGADVVIIDAGKRGIRDVVTAAQCAAAGDLNQRRAGQLQIIHHLHVRVGAGHRQRAPAGADIGHRQRIGRQRANLRRTRACMGIGERQRAVAAAFAENMRRGRQIDIADTGAVVTVCAGEIHRSVKRAAVPGKRICAGAQINQAGGGLRAGKRDVVTATAGQQRRCGIAGRAERALVSDGVIRRTAGVNHYRVRAGVGNRSGIKNDAVRRRAVDAD